MTIITSEVTYYVTEAIFVTNSIFVVKIAHTICFMTQSPNYTGCFLPKALMWSDTLTQLQI